ncbi:DUF6308 family protein [Nocardia sp. NPDC051756]|uniref:DUF6308 family protein n=1 Tax=Nocardia sp. NPDC051756 TaxID=3154751 RepID=UPI003428F116
MPSTHEDRLCRPPRCSIPTQADTVRCSNRSDPTETSPTNPSTTASKLLARKRPRLLPIWDSVVAGVFGTRNHHLVPVWEALRHRGSS